MKWDMEAGWLGALFMWFICRLREKIGRDSINRSRASLHWWNDDAVVLIIMFIMINPSRKSPLIGARFICIKCDSGQFTSMSISLGFRLCFSTVTFDGLFCQSSTLSTQLSLPNKNYHKGANLRCRIKNF